MEGNEGGFGGQLQKRSGAARRRQRMDRAPRAVRAPAAALDCPPAAPGRGGFTPDSAEPRGGVERGPWCKSPLAAAEAAPLANGLPRSSWTIVDREELLTLC